MLRDSIIAAIRTGVATLVGLLITFLVSQGIEIDDSIKLNLTLVLVALITAAYNWAVIQLEKHVHPYFGVLLGIPKTPSYTN